MAMVCLNVEVASGSLTWNAVAQAIFITKAIQIVRPCGFRGLATLLSVSITYAFSISNVIPRKL